MLRRIQAGAIASGKVGYDPPPEYVVGAVTATGGSVVATSNLLAVVPSRGKRMLSNAIVFN